MYTAYLSYIDKYFSERRKAALFRGRQRDKMEENKKSPRAIPPRGTAPKHSSDPHPKKKKHSKVFLIFKKLMTVIATTLLSLFLVIVITGTIVCTALTVYVLNFMDESTSITLQELESGSDTYFYGLQTNDEGEEELVVLHRVKTDVQRIPNLWKQKIIFS